MTTRIKSVLLFALVFLLCTITRAQAPVAVPVIVSNSSPIVLHCGSSTYDTLASIHNTGAEYICNTVSSILAWRPASLGGGALGSVPYQFALDQTVFLASPTTSGHTFFLGWRPSGSIIAPTAIDANSYAPLASPALTGTPTVNGVAPCLTDGTGCGEKYISFTTPLTASVAAGASMLAVKLVGSGSIDNFEAVAAFGFACTTNPTFLVWDCGTSATCASPTILASVTLTTANTITDGTISIPGLTGGHYLSMQYTTGACTSLSVQGSVAYH
jgi:hypothetical protein